MPLPLDIAILREFRIIDQLYKLLWYVLMYIYMQNCRIHFRGSYYGPNKEPRMMLTIYPTQAPINSILVPRQSSEGDNCPSTIGGGAIAGIVIGSIAGTLLILWLWRVFSLPGAWSGGDKPDLGYQPPIVRSSASTRGRRKRRRGSGTYVDYVEKPTSTRRYRERDDVRRPSKVYITDP
jgi:hypothetical protein